MYESPTSFVGGFSYTPIPSGGGEYVVAKANPNRAKAKEIWEQHGGEITNRSIASMLGEDEKKIAVWKQRDKWVKGDVVQQGKKCCTTKRKQKAAQALPVEFEENAEMTEKQRLFCLYYIKSFNATQSAIKAGYAKDSAHVRGAELLRNSKVRGEIKRLKGYTAHELLIDAMDVLQQYVKIAFADIGDYCRVEGRFSVAVTNSDKVDTSVVSEIKETQNGISLKLHDKMAALAKLEQYLEIMPDAKLRRKVEEERLSLEKKRLDILEAKSNLGGQEIEDDGFIDALKEAGKNLWKMEDNG